MEVNINLKRVFYVASVSSTDIPNQSARSHRFTQDRRHGRRFLGASRDISLKLAPLFCKAKVNADRWPHGGQSFSFAL